MAAADVQHPAYDSDSRIASGRAATPNASVYIRVNGEEVGTARANALGDWSMMVPRWSVVSDLTDIVAADIVAESFPPLPALPLPTGAKVMFLGHSFVSRVGYAFGNLNPPTKPNRIDIATGGTFSDVGFIQAMTGRININSWYDKDYAQNVAGDIRGLMGAFAGVGGDDIAGVLSRMPRLLPLRPDIVVLDIGTNDVNSRREPDGVTPITVKTMAARTEEVLRQWRLQSAYVIVLLPTPRTDWPAGDERHQRLADYGAWLASLKGREGIEVVEDRGAIRDAIAAGQPILEDTVHMTSVGHWIRNTPADRLLDKIRAMVTAGDFVDRSLAGNLLTTGGFLGTTGTKNNGVTGELATGLTISRGATNTETIVASKEVVTPGVLEKQVLTITPTVAGETGATVLTLAAAIPSWASLAVTPGSDWMELLCEVEVFTTESVFVSATLNLRYRGGLTAPFVGGIVRRGAENSVPIPVRNGEKFLCRILPHKIEGLDVATGVATYLDQMQIVLGWRKELTQPLVFKVSPLVYRKVASPRPAWNL